MKTRPLFSLLTRSTALAFLLGCTGIAFAQDQTVWGSLSVSGSVSSANAFRAMPLGPGGAGGTTLLNDNSSGYGQFGLTVKANWSRDDTGGERVVQWLRTSDASAPFEVKARLLGELEMFSYQTGYNAVANAGIMSLQTHGGQVFIGGSYSATPAADEILHVFGSSVFDGPARITPQGDLSMGEFMVEPMPEEEMRQQQSGMSMTVDDLDVVPGRSGTSGFIQSGTSSGANAK